MARSLLQATSFVAASALLVWVSRKPLLHPRSHGFYRFWAWEAITALVVLNLPVWVRAPFSPPQLLSWMVLIGSAGLVLHAALAFRRAGGRTAPPALGGPRAANYAFENTSHLVRVGPYRFIRHPMYASLLYLSWGVYLKDPASLPGVALVVVASVFLWLTARADESECVQVFGPEYEQYMSETRRFIPYLL
ncbi:MAG TPA: isoprenylcysteine carboxylmethyltransferase family protein [Longimicrobiales bacterium]